MTVKELKEVLEGCDDTAEVRLELKSGNFELLNEDVYQNFNEETGKHVVRFVCTL